MESALVGAIGALAVIIPALLANRRESKKDKATEHHVVVEHELSRDRMVADTVDRHLERLDKTVQRLAVENEQLKTALDRKSDEIRELKDEVDELRGLLHSAIEFIRRNNLTWPIAYPVVGGETDLRSDDPIQDVEAERPDDDRSG